MLGTVYKSTGSWYKVKLENGEFVDCKLFGKFRTKNLKSTNPVCVGDNVVIKITENKTPQIEKGRSTPTHYKNHRRQGSGGVRFRG